MQPQDVFRRSRDRSHGTSLGSLARCPALAHRRSRVADCPAVTAGGRDSRVPSLVNIATASATAAQCSSRALRDCSIWMPFLPEAVSLFTTLAGSSPPNSSPGQAMTTSIPEPTIAQSMASLICFFKAAGASPPTSISDRVKPWNATASANPREITVPSAGKLRASRSAEVACHVTNASPPFLKPLARQELAACAARLAATRSAWSSVCGSMSPPWGAIAMSLLFAPSSDNCSMYSLSLFASSTEVPGSATASRVGHCAEFAVRSEAPTTGQPHADNGWVVLLVGLAHRVQAELGVAASDPDLLSEPDTDRDEQSRIGRAMLAMGAQIRLVGLRLPDSYAVRGDHWVLLWPCIAHARRWSPDSDLMPEPHADVASARGSAEQCSRCVPTSSRREGFIVIDASSVAILSVLRSRPCGLPPRPAGPAHRRASSIRWRRVHPSAGHPPCSRGGSSACALRRSTCALGMVR